MNEFLSLLVGIGALWLVIIGGAMMVWGPRGASVAFRWPVQHGFRFARWGIGSLLALVGEMLRQLGEFIRR